MSRVKIVATIGPRTAKAKTLAALRSAGMDVARLNGSHGNPRWHTSTIDLLRRTLPDVPILFDLPGRKVRISGLPAELSVNPGDRVILSGGSGPQIDGKVVVNYPLLSTAAHIGDAIQLDDGSVRLIVEDINDLDLVCSAATTGVFRKGMGVHLPHMVRQEGFLPSGDQELIKLALQCRVDFIGVSYVEVPADVRAVREAVGEAGPAIITKIETAPALENISDLIEMSDGLMIDRGDLSMATSLESVALLQKRILKEAEQAACPVIVATEFLQSMVHSPVPTKAEVGDITQSVLDGASGLMLSAETAVGDYPVESIDIMRRVAEASSQHLQRNMDNDNGGSNEGVPLIIGDAIALICRRLNVTKVVAITISGYAARMVAARNPRQPILAVTNDAEAARRFNLLRGTRGFYVDVPFSRTSTDHVPMCLEQLWRQGELTDDDLILVTAVGYPRSGNRMNLIQTHRVADLKESLKWDS